MKSPEAPKQPNFSSLSDAELDIDSALAELDDAVIPNTMDLGDLTEDEAAEVSALDMAGLAGADMRNPNLAQTTPDVLNTPTAEDYLASLPRTRRVGAAIVRAASVMLSRTPMQELKSEQVARMTRRDKENDEYIQSLVDEGEREAKSVHEQNTRDSEVVAARELAEQKATQKAERAERKATRIAAETAAQAVKEQEERNTRINDATNLLDGARIKNALNNEAVKRQIEMRKRLNRMETGTDEEILTRILAENAADNPDFMATIAKQAEQKKNAQEALLMMNSSEITELNSRVDALSQTTEYAGMSLVDLRIMVIEAMQKQKENERKRADARSAAQQATGGGQQNGRGKSGSSNQGQRGRGAQPQTRAAA